jgi:hypothetical protein
MFIIMTDEPVVWESDEEEEEETPDILNDSFR